MAAKFKNRIDYVDISAYGIEKNGQTAGGGDFNDSPSQSKSIEDIAKKNHRQKE